MMYIQNFKYPHCLYCPASVNTFCNKEGCQNLVNPFINIGVQLHRFFPYNCAWNDYLQYCKFLSNIMDGNICMYCQGQSMKVDNIEYLKKQPEDFVKKIKDTGCQCHSNFNTEMNFTTSKQTETLNMSDFREKEPISYEVRFPKNKPLRCSKVKICESFENFNYKIKCPSSEHLLSNKEKCKYKKELENKYRLRTVTKTYSDSNCSIHKWSKKINVKTKKLQTNILNNDCKCIQTDIYPQISKSKLKIFEYYTLQNKQLREELDSIKKCICKDFYYMLKLYKDENKQLKKEVDIVRAKLCELKCVITENCESISTKCNQLIQTIPQEMISSKSIYKTSNRNVTRFDSNIDYSSYTVPSTPSNEYSFSSFKSSTTSTAVNHYIKKDFSETDRNNIYFDPSYSNDLSFCTTYSYDLNE